LASGNPADKALIPFNTPVEFTLEKDKMKFKANGKSYPGSCFMVLQKE